MMQHPGWIFANLQTDSAAIFLPVCQKESIGPWDQIAICLAAVAQRRSPGSVEGALARSGGLRLHTTGAGTNCWTDNLCSAYSAPLEWIGEFNESD